VAALAIVEDLEVVEDRVRQLDASAPPFSVQQLDLHPAPERLHDRVVETIPDRTHWGEQTGVEGSPGERPRGELRALVAVNNGASVGSALVDCHPERVGHERSSRSTVDRPPDYASRPGVEDYSAVDLSFSRRVLGHVSDPEFIGLVGLKLARDAIFCGRHTNHATKLWSTWDSLNLGPTHQELHGLVTNGDASA